ncbi:MAG: helix-turn-helix domain-containing protein [Thermoleophilia bacterium]
MPVSEAPIAELTIPQVAALLGVSLNTIRAWADSGEPPHRRTQAGIAASSRWTCSPSARCVRRERRPAPARGRRRGHPWGSAASC